MEYQTPGVKIERVSGGSAPIQGVASGNGAFVGLAEKGPVGKAVPTTGFDEYRSIFGGYDGALARHVERFFIEAGKGAILNIVRTVHYTDISDPATKTSAAASVILKKDEVDVIKVEAYDGAYANDYKVSVVDASNEKAESFDIIIVKDGTIVDQFKNLASDKENFSDSIQGNNVSLEIITAVRPDNVVDAEMTGGNNGLIGISDSDYIGSEAGETGLYALDVVDEKLNIAIPGIATNAVHIGGIAYAGSRTGKFFICEAPAGLNHTAAKDYKQAKGDYSAGSALNSAHSAIYYPWYYARNPITGGRELASPAAAMVGVYARVAAARGVHKAPAGVVDGRLRTAIGIERIITDAQQAILNPIGVNVIRSFSDAGIVSWGARTTSADPEWRYINVRQLFDFIELTLLKGTRWAVFEPNDQLLWGKLNISIKAFLMRLYRQGAFFDGGTGNPADAFFVKVDATTNTQSVIDAGQVVIEIGIAPSKPGEFIRVRISQWDGGRLAIELAA